MKKVVIIGAGFGGLSSACLMAKAGYDVTVLEKNEQTGGRASQLKAEGYTFDMGPSWYLLPDVQEHFFWMLGEKIEDYLELEQLEPSYRLFYNYEDREPIDIYPGVERNRETFEKLEPGSTDKFIEYLDKAEYQYGIAKEYFMYKNYDNIFDFFTWDILTKGMKLSVFKNMHKYVEKYFKTIEMQKIMQYTLVFLGSSPYNTPALYNIMTHCDFNLGVFYPKGGIRSVAEALVKIAEKNGTKFLVNKPVKKIHVENKQATKVETEDGSIYECDILINNADIHHSETQLLDPEHQTYPQKYWDKKKMSPSGFILYLGIDGKVDTLQHHNLVFNKDWVKGFSEIFDEKVMPSDPSYYVCAPSIIDPDLAPEGKENLFLLVPIAPGMDISDEELDKFEDKILTSMEKDLKIPNLKDRIEFKQRFCTKEFTERYNSYQGSALALAHTLDQTAIFRPNNKTNKVKNMHYVGGNTNPGTGYPICMISAQLAYKRIIGDKSVHPSKTQI